MKSDPKLHEWSIEGDSDAQDDPLLDCLVQLAKLHDHDISRTALRAGLPLENNCLTVKLVPRAAERAGLSVRGIRRSLHRMSGLELPAILLLKDKRACIALEVDVIRKTMKVLLPETGMGEEDVSFAELEKFYTGYVFFGRPQYKFKDFNLAESSRLSKNWFWGTLLKSWRIYRDVLIVSFLINLFGLATPFYILNVYDRVLTNEAFETLWVLSTGIMVIYVFDLLMRGLRGYFIDEAGKKANLIISATLFEKVLGIRMASRPKSIGGFTQNLQQFESVRDFITSFSITAVIDLPFVFFGLFAIWYLAGKIVIIMIISILILICYAFFVQIPLKRSVKKAFHASSQKNATLVEGLSGIETIKFLGAESKLQRSWEESVGYIANASASARFFTSSVNHIANFIRNVSLVATIIYGAYLISSGELTKGGLIACIILGRRAIAPMTQAVNLATRFHRAKEALRELNKIMDLPVERPYDKTFLHRAGFVGSVKFENVSFRYPDSKVEVLRNINIDISPGEHVAIIGPTGSGKTTMGKLLLGLFEVDSGLVSLDDTDIRQIDPSELRHFIGYVPQDITLFRGTVKENLIMGCQNIDDADVLRAADAAGVTKFIKKNPKGFDMEIGENGRGLSGGQRQSIAIARAILQRPPMLIMDEPSNAMDSRTETNLRKKMNDLIPGKTVIIITHRASLLNLVNRVVVLDDGQIIADGSPVRVLEAIREGHIQI